MATRGRDLIAAMFEGCEGNVELRALPSGRRLFCAPRNADEMAAFLREHRAEGVFVGVATRRSTTSGTLADCGHLGALFVDLDCKGRTIEEARAALNRFALPPSVVVASGGGLHGYWLLREPIDVQDDTAGLAALLSRLAQALDGDPAAAEPARILRLPGTFNHKYEPPRAVVVELFQPTRRYNPADFDELLPPLAAGPTKIGSGLLLDEPIAQGQRNPTLYRLARSLQGKKLPAPLILDALRSINKTLCCPPLPDSELDLIVHKALKQPNRPDYVPLVEPVRPSAPDALELTTLGDLLAEPDTAPDWLVADRVPMDGVVLFVGKPKAGKSTAVRALALAVAAGGTWLGSICLPRPVIYLALEDKRSEVKRHFRLLGATGGEPLSLVFPSRTDVPMSAVAKLAQTEAPGLIIVDTLQRLIRASNLNDYAEVTTLLTPLIAIARASHVAVVLVHHAGKGDRTGIDAPLGSTALAGSVDQVFQLVRTEKFRVFSTIQRIGPDLEPTVVELGPTGAPVLAGTQRDAEREDVAKALRGQLKNARVPLTADALGELVGGRKQVRQAALTWLGANGMVSRTGKGVKGDPFVYTMGPVGTEFGNDFSQDLGTKQKSSDSVPSILGEPNSSIPKTADQGSLSEEKCRSQVPHAADPKTETESANASSREGLVSEPKCSDSVPTTLGEPNPSIQETAEKSRLSDRECCSQVPHGAEPHAAIEPLGATTPVVNSDDDYRI